MGKSRGKACSAKRRDTSYCGICGSENLIIQGVIEIQEELITWYENKPIHEYEYMFPIPKNAFVLAKEILNNIDYLDSDKERINIDVWGSIQPFHRHIKNIYIVKCLDCKAIIPASEQIKCPSCKQNNYKQMINFHYIYKPIWFRFDGSFNCQHCGYRR